MIYRNLTIGDKDEEGNTLILGGWTADLYQTSEGEFILKHPVQTLSMSTPQDALRTYNLANGTSLSELPKYQPRKITLPSWAANSQGIRFESSRKPGMFYFVRELPSGGYYCTCPGWGFRKTCSHVDTVKDFEEFLNKGGTNVKG